MRSDKIRVVRKTLRHRMILRGKTRDYLDVSTPHLAPPVSDHKYSGHLAPDTTGHHWTILDNAGHLYDLMSRL